MIETPLRPTVFERSENEYNAYQFIDAKFAPPSFTHTMQIRPRLFTLLQRGLCSPLTLVSAPTGAGKTTLLSQWTQSLISEHVIWISFDVSDNEPLRFWNVLCTALAQKHTMFSTLQAGSVRENPSAFLTRLINACVAQQEPMVLVLDDYHTITESTIQGQMAYLIEHLPSHVHIVLSTRTDPYLPLARLRARNQVVEVRMNALRFTCEEAALFLREEMHLSLTDAEITYLVHHVDGWIAGLRLAGYALHDQYPAKNVMVAVRGSQRYLLDYILDEVLFAQEAYVQTFLLQTALLSHFSASLCDAVLGQQNCWQIVQYLERANLFLVAEDDEQKWYHFQLCFAEALRTRLERTKESEMIPILHRRASSWYEQHGFLVDAIEHLCEVQDWERVADLLERVVQQQSIGDAEIPSRTKLQNLLARLPEVLVQQRPSLRDYISLLKLEEQRVRPLSPPQEKKADREFPVQKASSQQILDPLSTREIEVLQFMAQGASNGEIADDLVIALGTVKRHVSNILSKLQADNRTHAVACARTLGLLY